MSESKSEILIYQAPDGLTNVDVRMEDETVWLTQGQMVELFQTTKQNISLHIRNVFEEGELTPAATVKESLTVQLEVLFEGSAPNDMKARSFSGNGVGYHALRKETGLKSTSPFLLLNGDNDC